MKRWWYIQQAGKRVRLATTCDAQHVWAGYAGYTLCVPLQPQAAAVHHKQDSTDGAETEQQITAPMTGRVVQMCVALGDTVDTGTTLVILEAMKMEYRVKCSKPGIVGAINCQIGNLVDLGTILVTLHA